MDGRDELSDEVVQAIPEWQVLVVQYNDAIARRLGVSTSDLQALFVLSRNGPSTPGTLAQHIGLTTGAASRMVDRLVAAELVTRTPDPVDRRRVVVTARTEALDTVARHYTPLNGLLREHLSHFDDAGLQAVLRFVRDARDSTRALLDVEPPTRE